MILKNARKLKDTGYYINEDFSKETVSKTSKNVIISCIYRPP